MISGKGNLFLVVEKAEKFRVNLVGDFLEILGAVLEFEPVHVDDEEFVPVVPDPVLVPFVESGDVVDSDALLVVSTAFLNLAHEIGD